jgi:hypothetical protein
MEQQPTVEYAKQSLTDHAASKGEALFAKYGPHIGWTELQFILADREFVRYPCEIVFDAAPLQEGEFAHPVAKGELPENGFRIHVHPYFALRPEDVPFLVLYHLVVVNYGDCGSSDDAEIFGANALGIGKEAYYEKLCQFADEISAPA